MTASSFTANWTSVGGATGYRLDVSTSSTFVTYVPGYQNLDVGNIDESKRYRADAEHELLLPVTGI